MGVPRTCLRWGRWSPLVSVSPVPVALTATHLSLVILRATPRSSHKGYWPLITSRSYSLRPKPGMSSPQPCMAELNFCFLCLMAADQPYPDVAPPSGLEFHPQGPLRCPVSGLVDQETCHMMLRAKGPGQRTMGELSLILNFDPYLLGCSAEQAKLSLGLESPSWCWNFLRRKEEVARVDQKQASCCPSAGYPSSAGGWAGRARNPFMLVTSLGA